MGSYGYTGHERLGKDGLVTRINQTELQLDLARGPAKTKEDYNKHGLYGSFYERRNRLREGRGRIKTLGNYPGREGRGWGGNSKNKHTDRTNRVFSFGASDAVDRHFDAKLLEFEAKLMAEETQVEAYENAVLPLHHQADAENIELQADEIHLKCDDFYASNTDGKQDEEHDEPPSSPQAVRERVLSEGIDPLDPANYPPHEAQLRIGASVKVVGKAPEGAVSSTNRIDGSYTLNVGGRLNRSCGEHNVEYKSGYELRVGGKKSELKAKKNDEFVQGHRSLINHAAYVNTNLLFTEAYVGPDTRVVGVNTLGLALLRMWGNLVPGVRTYGGLARLDKHLMPKYKVFEQKGGTRLSEVKSENRIAGTHLRAWYIFGARNKKPWWIKRLVKKEPQVMQKKLDALIASAGGLASAGGSSKAPVAITALANAAGLGDDAAAAATQSATVLNKAATVITKGSGVYDTVDDFAQAGQQGGKVIKGAVTTFTKGSPIYETADDALTAGQQGSKVATKVLKGAVTALDTADDFNPNHIYATFDKAAKLAKVTHLQTIVDGSDDLLQAGKIYSNVAEAAQQVGHSGVFLKRAVNLVVTAGDLVDDAGLVVKKGITAGDIIDDAALVVKKGVTAGVTAGDILDDAGNPIYGTITGLKTTVKGLLNTAVNGGDELAEVVNKGLTVAEGLDDLTNLTNSGLNSGLGGTGGITGGLGGTGGITGGLGGTGGVTGGITGGVTGATKVVVTAGGKVFMVPIDPTTLVSTGASGGGIKGGLLSGLLGSSGGSGFSFVPWSPPTGGLPRASALLVNPPSFLDPSGFWNSFVQSNFPSSFRNFI